MSNKRILIVDDEKNIRLTVSQSLRALDFSVQTAINGEEALQMLEKEHFDLIFLDLKMPGMDGMEVLQKINAGWPKIRVVISTAHGTIESAVEAMKLGAVDFIQKPFSPTEIRELAQKVLDREQIDEKDTVAYASLIELAKRHISDQKFAVALEVTHKAVALDPAKPEAYNLLGALLEIKGEGIEAQKFYRAALDIDPTFKSAWANLERSTSWDKKGKIELGPDAEKGKSGKDTSGNDSDD
jgi:DNA-binding response OmpR family regulator